MALSGLQKPENYNLCYLHYQSSIITYYCYYQYSITYYCYYQYIIITYYCYYQYIMTESLEKNTEG